MSELKDPPSIEPEPGATGAFEPKKRLIGDYFVQQGILTATQLKDVLQVQFIFPRKKSFGSLSEKYKLNCVNPS